MAVRQGKILVIDDNEDILFTLKMLLRPLAEIVTTCTSPKEINRLVSTTKYNVILLDMNFTADAVSGKEGFYWLERIREISPETVVILITAYSDTEKAVRAIKAGATDFIPKPWQNEKMLATISSALELSLRRGEVQTLKEQKSVLTTTEPEQEVIGESPAMEKIFKTVEKLKNADANILLQGENGTGKDLIAYTLHKQSSRNQEAFVPIDLGSIPHNLFESELFGHMKGAFTDARADRPGKFEAANNGTLFLDEIGNLSYHLQAKLLTAIQRRSIVRVGSNTPIPVNIRLVCATNRDLQEMVQKEQFREDLLYRINTIHVEIPSLRERPEDIVPLTEIFLAKYCNIYGKSSMRLSADAKDKLKQQPWFGNIRELEHTIEKAVIISEGETLDSSDFDFPRKKESPLKEATTLEEMEYNMIKNAMDKYNGNLSLVASQLGISRQTLYNKIKRYEL